MPPRVNVTLTVTLRRWDQLNATRDEREQTRASPDRLRPTSVEQRSAALIHCRHAMPIPNAAGATIAAEKLTAYLLNPLHKRGGAKAKRLLSLGYRTNAPEILEADLRAQHLSLDPARISQNAYGVVYEIDGSIKTPSGKMARFVSIWQIDTGSDVPRFITMYPR
jgi:hypothetical protein